MNSKIGLKKIFYNRLHNKSKSKLSNNNTISSSNINNSYHSYDRIKTTKLSTNLYFKPRPIYIIRNKNFNHNIGINSHQSKKPQEIETYEVEYSNGNVTLTQINTERNINNISIKKEYINNSYDNNKYKSLRNNSSELNNLNKTLNIRNYFNYKYEQIKKNFKLDRLNTYNFSHSTILKNNSEDNFGVKYQNKKIKNNTIYRMNNINYKGQKNDIKLKSSKSTDIVRLCKFLKNLNNKKGTLIKENEEGGIINFNKDRLEIQKQKNKYDFNYEKIVLIQKWWKKMKFKINIKKCVIIIQKNYRKYKFRKRYFKYIKFDNLKKIIYIQDYWKRHLMNIKQNNINFSFTNENTNINITNNNDILIKENKHSKNNNLEFNLKKTNNKSKIRYKKIINKCLITKKYYNNINKQLHNINIIKNTFKKYLLYKNQKQNNKKTIIYLKKILQNTKPNKSRNKTNNKKRTNLNINQNKNNKSFTFISTNNNFNNHSYITPKKPKKNNNIYKKESTFSTKFYKLYFKQIFLRYNSNKNGNNNIISRNINKICYISKKRKDINLLYTVKYIQNEIKKFLYKKKFKYYMYNNIKICDINKKIYLINYKLKKKIILLQKYIKNYLHNKTNKSNKINNNYFFSENKYSLTNDISDEKKYNENNTFKKNVSEFNLQDNENNNNDFILVTNKKENINTFISKNVTTFSFDFKDHDDFNNNINLDINNNKENIQDEDNDSIMNNNNINNFSLKNMLITINMNNSYNKLKNLFVTSITNKFSSFLILLLNRLNLFDFVKILSQKIQKSINQYIFFMIKKENHNNKNELFFFITLKRHIWYNIYINKENNEIKKLLKENVPKCFKMNNNNLEFNSYNDISIPYLNKYQEKNVINTNLFINNDKELIKYFKGFYNKNNSNKNNIFQEIKIKKLLNSNINIKNRNIFGITKYMDSISNKEFIYNKHNINNKMKIKQNNKNVNIFNEVNTNDNFFKEIDEDVEDENRDKNYNIENKLNKDLIHNNYCLTLNKSNYKFIDYLNEKYKNNKINETLPRTTREVFDYQIKDSI